MRNFNDNFFWEGGRQEKKYLIRCTKHLTKCRWVDCILERYGKGYIKK
jgi:hypothetical protein